MSSSEEVLIEELKGSLRSPIFNHTRDLHDRKGHESVIGRYTFTEGLLTEHVETVEEAKYAKAQAALDVWLGWISPSLGLEQRDGD